MEKELFSLGKEPKGVRPQSLLPSLSLAVAAATVLVFSVLFFTDVSFSFEATLSLSVSFLLLFFSSYVMYASLFETGKAHGERDGEFSALLARRKVLFERFREKGERESLVCFCRQVSDRETKSRREELLSLYFLTEEEFRALKEKDKRSLSRTERRAKRAIESMTAVEITPRALLADRPRPRGHIPLGRTPEADRMRRAVAFLLPAALFAALSVSVACHVLLSPTPDTVASFLLKLFALFRSAVKGYLSGFKHVTGEKATYLSEQCTLLEEYFKTQA